MLETELPGGHVINLVPYEGISLAIFGASGTGKTTLLRMIASHVAATMPTIVIDVKRSRVWDGTTAPFAAPWSQRVYENPYAVLEALRARKRRIWYRPRLEFTEETKARKNGLVVHVKPIEQFYAALYRYCERVEKPFCVLTDDTHELLTTTQAGDGSRRLQTLARERGVIRIWSAQRCSTLPVWTYSESQWVYAFRLGAVRDHKALQNAIGDYDNPPRHSMVVWHDDVGQLGRVNFDVGELPSVGRSSHRLEGLRKIAPATT